MLRIKSGTWIVYPSATPFIVCRVACFVEAGYLGPGTVDGPGSRYPGARRYPVIGSRRDYAKGGALCAVRCPIERAP